MEKFGVVLDESDAKLVVDRYDSDKDGRLGFWEFSNILLPIDTLMRDDLERRKAIWEISSETKDLMRKAFRKIIDAECILEGMR